MQLRSDRNRKDVHDGGREKSERAVHLGGGESGFKGNTDVMKISLSSNRAVFIRNWTERCCFLGPSGRNHPQNAAPDLWEAFWERHRVLSQSFPAGDLQRGAVRPAQPHRGRQRAAAALRRPSQQGDGLGNVDVASFLFLSVFFSYTPNLNLVC